MNYYNENDPRAATWLRELVARRLIPTGHVDTRSIAEVVPNDLQGFRQCHFFAGIGGWPLALALAGWPDSRPVWTGSCPCQPFSAAGAALGESDDRHLWPHLHRLARQCRPGRIFGEQVASADALRWLDLVFTDLEAEGYACGAVDLCAAGIGAPHVRQRIYWTADGGRLGDTGRAGLEGFAGHGDHCAQPERFAPEPLGPIAEASRRHASPWDDAEHIACLDGRARPIQPGIEPLAHGIPARVVRVRGYGNAIVPTLAAEFIRACDG